MIHFENITETFRLKFYSQGVLTEKKIDVLKDLSFKINPGEAVNLIGPNGCGKTTLLKIAAGLIAPQRGKVSVKGRTGLIMDIGCGFHPDLTARENIEASLPLYGIDPSMKDDIDSSVKEFSELNDFFDAPVRTYSQGMYLKMAFAFALAINPEIILIDDIIAVGDERSRFRCLEKIDALREAGKTVLLVTHDLNFARCFAERTIWLQDGRIVMDAPSSEVIPLYRKHFKIERSGEYSPLRFDVKSRDCTVLRWQRKELVQMEELKASFKYNGVVSLLRFTVSEKSSTFIRMISSHPLLSISLRLDVHVSENKKLLLELFIIDGKKELKKECLVCLILKNTFLKHIKLKKLPFMECRTHIPVYSGQKDIPYKGWFLPGASLTASSILEYSGENLGLSFVPHYPQQDFRLLALDLSLGNEEEAEADNIDLSIKNNFYELQKIDQSFRLQVCGEQFFAFEGINLLFEYEGVKFQLAKGVVRDVSIDKQVMRIIYNSFDWPGEFEITVILFGEEIVFKAEFKPFFKCVIENVVLQIILKGSNIKNIVSSDSKIYNLETSTGYFLLGAESKDKRIYKDSYKNAQAFMILLREEDEGLRGGIQLKKENSDPGCGLNVFKGGFFREGMVYFPVTERSRGLYMAFFAAGRWHDSSQAEWYKVNDHYEGVMPWLPVKIIVCLRTNTENVLNVGFVFIPLKDFSAERIQTCIGVDKQSFQFSHNNKKLTPLPDNKIVIVENLTLQWREKAQRMSAFIEKTANDNLMWHLDMFSEGVLFKQDEEYEFCDIQFIANIDDKD